MIGNWQKKQQRVGLCIKGKGSSWITVCSGVAQGSIRTGTSTVFDMNDLDDEIRNNVLKFAADIKVFRELKDNSDCDMLQSDLDKLATWSQK